ncbi:MAG: hypothetical protein IPL20_06690 [Saprospiraceae bacterium]|nr:hypothetical protein [Saprospiraceae bacterium]
MNETIIFIFVKWIFKGRFIKEDSTTRGWGGDWYYPGFHPGLLMFNPFQDWAGR